MENINFSLYAGIQYLDVCQNRSVLEIGPFAGDITDFILENKPSRLILLEACNENVVNHLIPKYKDRAEIIHGDMHYDIHDIGKVDVVVMYGIIYHSHAPFLLLEEVVNHCDPDIILLDAPGSSEGWGKGWGITCVDEETNTPGMRHTFSDWKSCRLVTPLDEGPIIKAMKNLGFYLEAREKKYVQMAGKHIALYLNLKNNYENINTRKPIVRNERNPQRD
jgi:hypothetical protein